MFNMNKNIWQVSNTKSTTASSKAIWKRWTAVSEWPEEDNSLEWAKIEGDFAVGTKIIMKPKGFPKSSVVITKLIPNKSYVTTGNIPLGKMTIEHTLVTKNGNTIFTHTISLTGPMRNIFAKFVAQKMADNLPEKMRNIARLAEKNG